MNPLTAILCEEIRRSGPIPFSRFMEAALYHPVHGYYCRNRDPFGKQGDYYTAEQLQPAFGRLMARRIEDLCRGMDEITVVEMGAGRQEMAPHFARWNYVPVDVDHGVLPDHVRGVIFCNEFFDAVPVDAVAISDDGPRLLRVDWSGERFIWTAAERAHDVYIRSYFPHAQPGDRVEVALAARGWIERLAASLERGFIFIVDYGYTTRETPRFPQGTLMSYRRHTALEDVLADPGARDITAHVHFTALEDAAGLRRARFTSLANTILDTGEETVAAVADSHPLQLKTLLFGMGETFRTLILEKT
jgi:SAM-dependent MidA family methyltransferase